MSYDAARMAASIFICYRRTDGKKAARWLYDRLRVQTFPHEGHAAQPLELYVDIETPHVGDWTDVHQQALTNATALLLVVTPGVFSSLGPGDWVQKELTWWLRNRTSSPILVETTGEGDRWIPPTIKARWPLTQRIELDLPALDSMLEAERAEESNRIIRRIVDGFDVRRTERAAAEKAERVRAARLTFRRRTAMASIVAGGAVGIAMLTRKALKASADLEKAQSDLNSLRLESQARQLEGPKKDHLEALKREKPGLFRAGEAKLWPRATTLNVGFLDGTAAKKEFVRKAFREWLRFANVNVTFNPQTRASIRVSFNRTGGSWSFTGTDALGLANLKEPTINLGFEGEGAIPYNYLHEIGHTFGLVHETSNPAANLDWDKDAVYRLLSGPPNNWSYEDIEANLFDQAPYPGARPFDEQSIMLYEMPAEWFQDHRGFSGGKTLSESDGKYIASLYPT
jgi:serralysin